MKNKIPQSLKLLDGFLADKQMSAYALSVRLGAQSFTVSGGYHAHPGSGAIASATENNSLFDLASLTKIFATAKIIHAAKRAGLLRLDDPYKKYFPKFPHIAITLQQLLDHRSGFPAHIEFFKRFAAGDAPMGDVSALERWIYETPLKHPVGSVTEYSDLGIMLLGFLLEKIYSKPLAQIFQEQVVRPLGLDRTGYVALPHSHWQDSGISLHFAPGDFVATETCPWRKRTMQGEVHDDNTWAMGGVAPHAGLFSTAPECLKMLDHLVGEVKADKDFILPSASTRQGSGIFENGFLLYPGLRAFAGDDFAGAFGFTGFVGTSAWHDPARDLSVVLLTNRVHPSRNDTRWIVSRLEFHQSLWRELR